VLNLIKLPNIFVPLLFGGVQEIECLLNSFFAMYHQNKGEKHSWCTCEPKLEEEEFLTPKKVSNSQVVFQCQCMPIFVRVQPISAS
jgi:hypothetical protein